MRNLSFCVVAQRKWQLEGLDVSTAFFQTGKTEESRHIWQGIPELNRALVLNLMKQFESSRMPTAMQRRFEVFGKMWIRLSGLLADEG